MATRSKTAALGLILALGFTGCAHTLTMDEFETLRRDKSLWTWDSSHGKQTVHYTEAGEGDNHVILLHGLSASTYTWRNTVRPLVDAGCHVWALDFVGFGLSDKPEDAAYGFELFIEQVQAFMDAKGIAKAHLVGNSMGGGVSLGVALYAKDRVKSITLVDAAGYPLEVPFLLRLARSFPWMAKAFSGRWSIEAALGQVVYDGSKITEEQIDAYHLPQTTPYGENAMLDTVASLDNRELADLSKLYKDIAVPALVIWGDKDAWTPPRDAYRFHEDIADSRLVMIENCGHIPQEECPEAFLPPLLAFIEDVSTPASCH